MSEKRFLLIVAVAVAVFAVGPYWLAFESGDGLQQFGGFLINPVDGYSYLAKMRQGYQGEWRFTLPYTAEAGQGAYLFLFYISLGHLARKLSLSLIGLYHVARILGGFFLIWAIYRLADQLYSETWTRNLFLILASLGSGLGWVAVFVGRFTSDFWVAEAYPFLSLYTNPHFTIGLGLMILALLPAKRNPFFRNLVLGGLIAIIQPFGVVIVGLVKLVETLSWIISDRPSPKAVISSSSLGSLAGFGLGGGSALVYQFWVILSDPNLAAWNAQNLTPTPGLADLAISFSPVLVVALLGIKSAWKNKGSRKLVYWMVISLVLIIIPWSLQRRFLTGLYLPLAGLCVWGISWLGKVTSLKRNFWIGLILVLSLPTNIIVILSGIQAANRQDPQIYIPVSSIEAFQWLSENSNPDDLVAAEPEQGIYIPAYTGRRVIYGHPFETISAIQEQELLAEVFYQNHPGQYYQEFSQERRVAYYFLTEDANPNLESWLKQNWLLAYQAGTRKIYSRRVE